MIGKVFRLFFVMMLVPTFLWGTISGSARLDRDQVPLGQTVSYEIILSGETINNVPAIALPEFDGAFRVVSSSQSSNFTMINGQLTSRVSKRYVLRALKEGDFVIGQATINHEGTSFQTQSLPIKVTPAQAHAAASPTTTMPVSIDQRQAAPIFVEASLSKQSLYAGEQTRYILKLYRRIKLWDQPQVELPNSSDVFAEVQPVNPGYETVNRDGYRYVVTTLASVVMTPINDGELTIPPARVGYVSNPIIGQQVLESEPKTLEVIPLPEDGKPAFYSGQVGKLGLSMSPWPEAPVTQNRPLTIQLQVTANRPLDQLTDLHVHHSDAFRVVKSVVRSAEERGVYRQVFEYVVIPKKPGQWPAPQFKVASFDPGTTRYLVVQTPAFMVDVFRDPELASADPVKLTNVIDESVEKQPLRPFKSVTETKQVPVVPWQSLWFWVLLIVNGMILGYGLWPQLQQRFTPPQDDASVWLRQVKDITAEDPLDASKAAALHQLLLELLATKVGATIKGLSTSEREALLMSKQMPEALVQRVTHCLEATSRVAYAPLSAGDGDQLIKRFQECLLGVARWRVAS